jgi:ABC-2 type transport system permease protein
VQAVGLDPAADFVALSAVVFRKYESEAAALPDLRARRLEAAYLVPADYLETGRVRSIVRQGGPVLSVRGSTVEPVLAELLTDRLLASRVSDDVARRVRTPVNFERATVAAAGAPVRTAHRVAEQLVRTAVPFLLGVLLLTALLSASGYLVQAVALDKESKVVEVLLSSATPDEILTGKLLGLGTAGLLQFFVWSGMVVGAAVTAASALSNLAITVPWAAIAVSPLFFVLGYLFVGSLMLATGSLGGSAPEGQKLTLGWAVLSVLPLMVMLILLEQPHGTVARVLTFVPFSAPLTVVVRLSVDPAGIAVWEVVGALVVLLLSTWVSIRIGARLFRVGLLLTGSRPGWAEIWRQARLP